MDIGCTVEAEPYIVAHLEAFSEYVFSPPPPVAFPLSLSGLHEKQPSAVPTTYAPCATWYIEPTMLGNG